MPDSPSLLSAKRGFVRVTREPKKPGATERAREFVWQMNCDHGMHFHEIAMSNPFKAEQLFQELAAGVLAEIGAPRSVKCWTYSPEESS